MLCWVHRIRDVCGWFRMEQRSWTPHFTLHGQGQLTSIDVLLKTLGRVVLAQVVFWGGSPILVQLAGGYQAPLFRAGSAHLLNMHYLGSTGQDGFQCWQWVKMPLG